MTRYRVLLELFFFTCMVILFLNDHHWKCTYGNFLTGKLSDLAGPFVALRFGLALPLDSQVIRIYFVALAILLVAIKVSQTAANFVAESTCSAIFDHCKIIADPMDLWAMAPGIICILYCCLNRKILGLWA